VLSTTKASIEATRELQTRVANLSTDSRSFSSVFIALADAEAKLDTVAEPLSFYQNVSPSKELRDASNQAEILLRDFAVEASMRVDVYNAVKGAAENVEKSKEDLGPEEKRLIEKMLLDGKRAGLALPEEDRKELTDVRIRVPSNIASVALIDGHDHFSSRKSSHKPAWSSPRTLTRRT
jgi:Zn-dependent oligopeptidase